MYDYLKGKITSKQLNSYRGTYIVVETNNIGYLISTKKRTIERIDETDKEYKIYVSLSHKEDSMTLTGFITKEETSAEFRQNGFTNMMKFKIYWFIINFIIHLI